MLTKTIQFEDRVVVVFQNQVDWSSDGLKMTFRDQLDAKTFTKVKKAYELLGGKWDRKENAVLFQTDPRPEINSLTTKGVLSVARDGFFRTPWKVTDRLLSLMNVVQMGDYPWLEPECGDGAIVEYLIKSKIVAPEYLYCIEQNPKRCQIVRESFPGVHVACGDFLKYRNSTKIPFRYILMNPPFENGQDIEHIRRAYNHLAVGGVLGAVLGESAFFRSEAKYETFRAWLKAVGAYHERLPEHSFRESGTDVATRILVVEKA